MKFSCKSLLYCLFPLFQQFRVEFPKPSVILNAEVQSNTLLKHLYINLKKYIPYNYVYSFFSNQKTLLASLKFTAFSKHLFSVRQRNVFNFFDGALAETVSKQKTKMKLLFHAESVSQFPVSTF